MHSWMGVISPIISSFCSKGAAAASRSEGSCFVGSSWTRQIAFSPVGCSGWYSYTVSKGSHDVEQQGPWKSSVSVAALQLAQLVPTFENLPEQASCCWLQPNSFTYPIVSDKLAMTFVLGYCECHSMSPDVPATSLAPLGPSAKSPDG